MSALSRRGLLGFFLAAPVAAPAMAKAALAEVSVADFPGEIGLAAVNHWPEAMAPHSGGFLVPPDFLAEIMKTMRSPDLSGEEGPEPEDRGDGQ